MNFKMSRRPQSHPNEAPNHPAIQPTNQPTISNHPSQQRQSFSLSTRNNFILFACRRLYFLSFAAAHFPFHKAASSAACL